jgi:hypothetical protein
MYGEYMSDADSKVNKELQKRMKEFKAALKNEAQKQEFLDNLPLLIRIEVFLPSTNPEEYVNGLYLYMGDAEGIVNAEYYFQDKDEVKICSLSGNELEVVKELFKDEFDAEME